jgi:MFS transporter, UMF1 family
MLDFKKGCQKTLNAWAFYDWANSVYSLTIVSSIFPLFIGAYVKSLSINEIPVFGIEISHTALITYITAFGFLVVSILSPILSGVADYKGNKKLFLRLFCYIGSFSCIGLYFFSFEYLYISLALYVTALIGFWGSLVFYNSYLPDIAFKDQQDAISAKGYSLGYVGSVILLLINLTMILSVPEEYALQMMRYSFVLVGLWWFGFSHYTYRYLPDFTNSKKISANVLWNGINEMKSVWFELQNQVRLKKYLIAFFVYSMAVQTVMLVASFFGENEINWEANGIDKTMGLIISILIIQLIAVFGAYLTSYISKKFGNINTLILINLIWVCICVFAYFVTTAYQFFFTAGVVGLVMGGIQSLSRSTYAKFLPETNDTTSYFSFYDVSEKIGIVIGMVIFASVEVITGSMRDAILFLVVFFLLGLVLLFKVPEKIK